jgi:metal-responsive CopG/Arc/MetJ family transcriptional regulator
MKSAISVPDRLFAKGEKLAKKLKISRSALYSKALEQYVQRMDDEQITAKFNEVYSKTDSHLDEVLLAHQRRMILENEWK